MAYHNFSAVTADHPEEPTAADGKICGPILSLDLGSKRVGAAASDPDLIAITRLTSIRRSSWKQLLRDVCDLIRRLDAKTLVIGFPLSLNGNEGPAAKASREVAYKFALSLELPVYLQDERLTSVAAQENLAAEGFQAQAILSRLDSESAAMILRDFIAGGQQRILVQRPLK